MTQGERIKYLRKEVLHFTLEQFGEHIGIKKSAMSQIENGKNNLTDQVFKSICREFNVNPDWLRDEQGPVLLERSRSQQIEEFIRDILTNEPEGQKVRLISALASLDDKGWDMMYNLALKMVGKAPDEIEREKMHADLDRQLDEEKEAMGGSGASQAM